MNLLKTLSFGLLGADSAPQADEPLREAAGATIDHDEDQWRRLSGDGNRDLAPMTQDRMQRLAHFVWESNLLANRLIELPVAYLLSQGVRLQVDDAKAQAALDRHWKDGLNAWDLKLPKRVRELALFGEQCWPVFRSEANGFVRLGYLDPALIETVVTDPDNREQPIGIVTKRDRRGQARRYRVIVNVPEAAFTQRTQEIRATFTTGDCFYFRVNDLSSATRGRSDLLAQLDWLDAYDQFLFGEVDRSTAARAFIWDVTLTGASPDEVRERASKITPPRPNSVRVHNDSEKWEAVAPSLNSYDAANNAKLIRNHMLGGATVPEHWYGGASDVNRATGDSMAEPTEKVLEMRQTLLGYMLCEVGSYVIRSAWGALDRELRDEEVAILDSLLCVWPQMTNKDTTKYAAALQQVTAACAQALAEGLISRLTALRLIAACAERLGVEIEPETELESALSEYSGGDIPPPPDPADVDPDPTDDAR